LLSLHDCVFIHVEFNLLEFPPFVTLSFVLAGEWSLCYIDWKLANLSQMLQWLVTLWTGVLKWPHCSR